MFFVVCECGTKTQVREAQAGLTVRCSNCATQLNVPSLGALREYADRGQPAPTTKSIASNNKIDLPEQFLLHCCGDVGTGGHISSSAIANYTGVVSATIETLKQSVDPPSHFEVMVSCALIPNGKKVIVIETAPERIERVAIDRLKSAIRDIPSPPVQESPVAFAIYQRIHMDKADQIQLRPFGEYSQQIATRGIESTLLDLAEGHPDDVSRNQDTSSAGQTPNLMTRLYRWLFPPKAEPEPQPQPEPSYSAYEQMKHWVEFVESAYNEPSKATPTELAELKPRALSSQVGMASRHMRDQRWDDAIKRYDAALDLAPDFAPLYGRRSAAYRAAGNRQASLVDLNRAIELAPAEPWFYSNRSMIYADLEAWSEAEADLGQACVLAPQEPEFVLKRAGVRLAAGKPAAAMDDLQKGLLLDPNCGAAHMQLGSIYQAGEWSDMQRSASHLTRAIELMPFELEPLIHRGLAYAAQNKFELALDDCDSALKLQPDSDVAHGLRGRILQMNGEFDEAITACTHAIDLGCSLPMVFLARGLAYAATEQLELARSDCETALQLDPENPSACHFKGMLSLQMGELDNALEALKQARDMAPDWAEPRMRLALVHRMNEDPKSAVEEQSVLIEQQPDCGAHYLNRAHAYAQLGAFDDAVRDYDHACHLEPQNEEFLFFRGCYYMDRQQPERALQDLDRALELADDHDDARLLRASILLQLKRQKEALAEYERLISKYPDDPYAYAGRAHAHQMDGNEQAAEADFDQLKEIAPEQSQSTEIQSLWAKVNWLESQERYDEAIEASEEIIALVPDEPTGYVLRAWIYWYTEQYVEACDDYTRLLEMKPGDASYLNSRGQVQAEMGDFRPALDDLDAAVDGSRESGQTQVLAYALNGRALALAGIGRHDESKQDFEESIRLCPDNGWAYYNRGLVLFQQDQTDEAKEQLMRALRCNTPQLTKRKRDRAQGILKQID